MPSLGTGKKFIELCQIHAVKFLKKDAIEGVLFIGI